MRNIISVVPRSLTSLAVVLALVMGSALISAPAHAFDRGGRGWHGGGWGWGLGIGLATGLAVDAALGWPGYYYRYPYAAYPYAAYPYAPYSYAVPAAPAVTVIQQAPVAAAPPVAAVPAAAPAQVQYWYYCNSPKGYYPYVPSCKNAWTQVPTIPPGVAR